jgi:hypothetical protein
MLVDGIHRMIIRFEVFLLAGEEIAALAGFRVQDLPRGLVKQIQHLVSAQDASEELLKRPPVSCPSHVIARKAAIGNESLNQNRRCLFLASEAFV